MPSQALGGQGTTGATRAVAEEQLDEAVQTCEVRVFIRGRLVGAAAVAD